ncbi:MAG: Fic family protein [Cyanobacteria bacterium J06635_1]
MVNQDALELHLQATSAIDWCTPSLEFEKWLSQLRPSKDLHDAQWKYIEQFDLPRSAERGHRIHNAVQLVRQDATRKVDLTFARLQSWQCVVLGADDVPFRNQSAFAKGGLEVYGWKPELEFTFSEKLLHDSRDNAHPLSKAVRAYLDICFYHPFSDGNARAARLVFEFFIKHGGFFIKDLQPVFSLPRVAGRKEDYLDFLRMVVILCQRSGVSPKIAHSCSGQLRDF